MREGIHTFTRSHSCTRQVLSSFLLLTNPSSPNKPCNPSSPSRLLLLKRNAIHHHHQSHRPGDCPRHDRYTPPTPPRRGHCQTCVPLSSPLPPRYLVCIYLPTHHPRQRQKTGQATPCSRVWSPGDTSNLYSLVLLLCDRRSCPALRKRPGNPRP